MNIASVGSFKSFHEKIQNSNMFENISDRVKNGMPILGICLGFPLFEKLLNDFNGFRFVQGTVDNLKFISREYSCRLEQL